MSIHRVINGVALLAAPFLFGCSPSQPSLAGGTRVVSLAPSITEIICAVGGKDLLVGRTSACDYPAEAMAGVPIIGGFGTPSLELLISASPTLILDVGLDDEALARKIEALGLRRQRVPCATMDEIPDAILKVGSLLNLESNAVSLADDLRAGIARLREQAKSAANCPSVFAEIWHDPVTTVGTNTFLSEIIRLAGGRNIGDAVAKDYFQISPEWVVARDPDVILCLYMSEAGLARDIVIGRAGWRHINAIRNNRVYDGLDNNLILRPGPRVLQGIAAVRARIHGG